MNRRILPPTIVAVTLTIILGLLFAVRLFAATAAETTTAASAFSAAQADFAVRPLIQGQFTSPGSTAVFKIEIENTGDTLTDTYELEVTSDWSTTLYGADGSTPLVDTNGSGEIDTDIVLQGESFLVTVRVDTPSDAVIGDGNDAQLTVRSTVSPALALTASMRSAVPAPFAQTLFQQLDANNSLLMAQPNASWRSQTSPIDWFDRPDVLPDLALAETDSGYFYLWTNQRPIGNIWRSELEFLFTDKPGQPVSSISKLTDHASVMMETLDARPAVAVAPNGNIGVSWYRTTTKIDGSQLFNVYLAILDPTGQPVTDTINVTDNAQWRAPVDPGFEVPSFRSPRVAATGDDHFFVAWLSSVVTHTEQITKTYDLNDIYYAIYASDGVSVTEAIKVSENVSGTRSLYPTMTGVGDDRVFLSWAQRRPADLGGNDIIFTVIDSSNVVQQSKTPMAEDSGPLPIDWSNYDVVELSSGDIVAAWEAWYCDDYGYSPRIRYAVFRGSNYNRVGQPACLPPTVVAHDGDDGVSLVADNQNHAILTWTDRDAGSRSQLYYALLNANGNLATEPMIFYQNGPAAGRLSTGLFGYASASRIFLDTAATITPPVRRGIPTDPVSFTVEFRNDGSVEGTGATLTMTLPPSLTYLEDTAAVPPEISDQDVVWTLGDVAPWSHDSFVVSVGISSTAKLLHTYPLTVTIAVEGQESTLANNRDSAQVVIRRPLYLPSVVRPD